MVDAIDLDAEAQVLPGAVPGPLPPWLDQHAHRICGLALDTFDTTAQLARRPQGVDQLEVVIGKQRRGERADQPERASTALGNLWERSAFSHEKALVV